MMEVLKKSWFCRTLLSALTFEDI